MTLYIIHACLSDLIDIEMFALIRWLLMLNIYIR